MTRTLDLADIQGNIPRAYGRFGFPFARYFFFHISDRDAGRRFVDAVRMQVTTATRWNREKNEKPDCTTNIAFTFQGLLTLGVPTRTLQRMPVEFIEGMKARAFVLGDRDVTKTEAEDTDWDAHWDDIWKKNRNPMGDGKDDVHIWISLNAQPKDFGVAEPCDALEAKTQWLQDLCARSEGGVRLLDGNGPDAAEYQSANAVFAKLPSKDAPEGFVMVPTGKEHFGYTDGISDPVFEGQHKPEDEAVKVKGGGKIMNAEWKPLATGEFLLGHPDESQELPPAAAPGDFSNNGCFMAYRKLHENVSAFNEVIAAEAARYAAVNGGTLEDADQTLRAKICGRWSDGIPLAKAPTIDDWKAVRKKNGFSEADYAADPAAAAEAARRYFDTSEPTDFRYGDDMQGYGCPIGSHINRVNTRDYLDPLNQRVDPKTGKPADNPDASSQLNKRRRILRRGLPYGPLLPGEGSDDGEQGIAMMILCASLFRQFEFVQQQWIEYGLDFNQGNNTCPMLGNHETHKRFTIAADPATGKKPFVMSMLKTFVECRGGDYFFIPSMTSLRIIAQGIIDPT